MKQLDLKRVNGGNPVGWFIAGIVLGLVFGEMNDRNAQRDYEEGASDARKWLGKE